MQNQTCYLPLGAKLKKAISGCGPTPKENRPESRLNALVSKFFNVNAQEPYSRINTDYSCDDKD